MTEIQGAIEKLPVKEKKALSTWLSSQDESEMSAAEKSALLASLDKAARQLDEGQRMTLNEARNRVRQWASK